MQSLKVFLSLGLATLLWAHAQGADRLRAAQAEGKVVFYANITGVEPVMEAFQKKYGLKGDYVRVSTDKFIPTVLTEHRARKLQADVLQAPLPVMEILKKEGVLGRYESPESRGYPAWARDPEGFYQIFAIEYIAILYNTRLVKPEEAPTSYKDLADPKWRGKIVMPDPTSHPTTITWLVGLRENGVFASEDEWMSWLRGLAANNPMLVASLGPTPDVLARGERAIGISMPKYLVTKAPAPLMWVNTREGLFGSPRALALAQNPARPNAGRVFMDFWLSREAQQILAEQVGEYTLLKGTLPPIPGIGAATVRPVRELSDEELSRWSQVFGRIFRR
ncbi:MAG: extracellular solute-binding protein [Thermus sp.]|nr:extracellular solute-binding protein [Thermus sp.]